MLKSLLHVKGATERKPKQEHSIFRYNNAQKEEEIKWNLHLPHYINKQLLVDYLQSSGVRNQILSRGIKKSLNTHFEADAPAPLFIKVHMILYDYCCYCFIGNSKYTYFSQNFKFNKLYVLNDINNIINTQTI